MINARYLIRWLNNTVKCLFLFFLWVSCKSEPVKENLQDTAVSGTIHVSIDESFKPVMDEQIKVFGSQFPEAHIIAHYKPEAACLRDLAVDSIRMIFTTHELSDTERNLVKEKMRFFPRESLLAYDAIAVLVNKTSPDTSMNWEDLRGLATGTGPLKYKLLVDGLSATSTVKYIIDSLSYGAPLGKNVVAAANSQGVIDYVSNNADAVGLLGVCWIGNNDDPEQKKLLQKVKIVAMECRSCQPKEYVRPYQSNISTLRYPMVRALRYILKENYSGLGSGFMDFLIYEKGQLIFKRSYLWPAKMDFERRNAELK
jgi:phosphate transport system substrate-binding protein